MAPHVQFWKKAPLVRFLIALIAGIVIQWHVSFSISTIAVVFATLLFLFIVYSFLTVSLKYLFRKFIGIVVHLLIAVTGAALIWLHDIRNNKNWIGQEIKNADHIVVRLNEPLVEKPKSYKAEASFLQLQSDSNIKNSDGKLIIYFKKDSLLPSLQYGSRIVFKNNLQEIKNSGNPGGFDYKRYLLFQGITHQTYLRSQDFIVLPPQEKNWFKQFIFTSRTWVVETLRKNIKGEKEQGLAEALLIGYKDDLDKKLVEAYSNTGVVHIIAISGLHLGLIYWLLLLLTKPLKKNKKLQWPRLLIILSSLWIFSILAGGSPSVLRSAIMFSIIAAGEVLSRKSSVYNTLALSAFLLLCLNPFWLWDVGFQLSYAAVLSIIIFYKPIYNWAYSANKLLDFFWKLIAITLAAQLLTLPISIYHFHQMPLLFLFTNIVAVPLSSLILIGEIFICAFSFFPWLAQLLGSVIEWLIYLMNSFIERMDLIPFSVWNGLSISFIQVTLLLAFVAAASYWLLEKKKKFIWVAASFLFVFMVLRSVSFLKADEQHKLIVYNVPKFSAMDIIQGRDYTFIGDTTLIENDFIKNFHLQPSRILHRLKKSDFLINNNSLLVNDKKILIIDTTKKFLPATTKNKIDLLILSKNPKLYISNLLNTFIINQIVIDGSVPVWKARLWQQDCDSLKISCHNVSDKGAFVMNLE